MGKTDNCVVSVHLGYAAPEFHALLDGELYLPETDAPTASAAGRPRMQPRSLPGSSADSDEM